MVNNRQQTINEMARIKTRGFMYWMQRTIQSEHYHLFLKDNALYNKVCSKIKESV